MQIYLAADHAGYERKEFVKAYFDKKGITYKDFGAHELDTTDDYPDFVIPTAKSVVKDQTLGIVFCGNAEGICIAANKVDGIRAGIGYSNYAAESMKQDDDTNILCVPGRALTNEEVLDIIDTWLDTEFSGEERHIRRLNKIKDLEQSGQ